MKLILILLSAILIAPNFIDVNINKKNEYNKKEEFSPQLNYIRSLDKLEQHTDSIAAEQHISESSAEYFILLESVIAQRFYHGFSRYKLKQNWIAAVSERLIGFGLACKVDPDDILQNRSGACSQQAAVMMAIAKRKQVDYRSVGFPHHYAMEVRVNGSWYFLDPNMEPKVSKKQRMQEHWHGRSDELKKFYDTAQQMDYAFGMGMQPNFSRVNVNPAPRLKIFHAITLVLSRIAWCFPLFLIFVKRRSAAFEKTVFHPSGNLFPLLPA